MISKDHFYNINVWWTGNKGAGTSGYRSYERNYIISAENKPEIHASADPAFRGDKTKYNPEELLLASLSGCHMLWFLHLCADNGIVVVDYVDNPTGVMIETPDGSGKFREATLNPEVTITDETMVHLIDGLHKKANELCFIANSVNFPVEHNCRVNVRTV